eukprot:755416-Hanusia_phi.AAC.3
MASANASDIPLCAKFDTCSGNGTPQAGIQPPAPRNQAEEVATQHTPVCKHCEASPGCLSLHEREASISVEQAHRVVREISPDSD